MKNQTNPDIKAHVLRGALYLVLFVAVGVMVAFSSAINLPNRPPKFPALQNTMAFGGNGHESALSVAAPATQRNRMLTFSDRVAYQRAIEDVYWQHRIWPNGNPGAKPPLDRVMSQAQIEKKVEHYLRNSQALEDYWQSPITPDQLQREIERMATHTKQPGVLRELFAALGNDPFVISECLVRPILAECLVTELYAHDQKFQGELRQRAEAALQTHGRVRQMNQTSDMYTEPTETDGAKTGSASSLAWLNEPLHSLVIRGETQVPVTMAMVSTGYTLPAIDSSSVACPDNWVDTNIINAPDPRAGHTAVWTGTEMIVWGGSNNGPDSNTGGRYSPATDSWIPTSTTNSPDPRAGHIAVWTGTEMIVWGGGLNTGGRYNPSSDSWIATSTTNAPTGRPYQTAVWTGNEMIVWGGGNPGLNTGGRYNPSGDSWIATSPINAPEGRYGHTAVWTGSEMVIWGGHGSSGYLNTGGRYNPGTDSWISTGVTNVPEGRYFHTAVWNGTEMIVWGGIDNFTYLNTGGRYNPVTDGWIRFSNTNAPSGRQRHTAVWTGSEMIVWGGDGGGGVDLNTGGKYDPSTDSWIATSLTNAPDPRVSHTAIWTDSEMVVWGGGNSGGDLSTGGRYCAASTPPPTTRTVTNSNDSGPGSLREALSIANDGDTINFSITGTITLTTGELDVNASVTISGPGGPSLAVDGNAASRVFYISSGKTVSISGLTITNGNVPNAYFGEGGAGIWNDHGTLTLSNCTISNNSTGNAGGGIRNSGSLTLTTCTVSNNQSSEGFYAGGGFGGGIYDDGQLTITNCTVSGNRASGGSTSVNAGGGIFSNSNSTLTINNSTIVFNDAHSGSTFGGSGGGISANTVAMKSTLLALNTADNSYDGNCTVETNGYNLIGNTGGGSGNGITIAPLPTDQIGTPSNPINPLIGALGDNGGPTFTHALQPGSPAIDRGAPDSPPQDQRGYPRVGLPDVGAFELQTPSSGGQRYDFNGDGYPDLILYNESTGQTAIVYMNDNVVIGAALGPTLPLSWPLIDEADFNGDNHPDYLLYNESTGQTAILYMDDNLVIGAALGPTLPPGWQLIAAGDFNGDGQPDYVAYNSASHVTVIAYMNNTVLVGAAVGPTLPTGWVLVGLADYNADGAIDYLLFNPTTSQTALVYLNNDVVIGAALGPPISAGYTLAGTADFNRDGYPDYLLDGDIVFQHMHDTAIVGAVHVGPLPAPWVPANGGAQLRQSCFFAISPHGRLFTSAANNGSFTVLTNQGCQWEASTEDEFITVTSQNPRFGSGSVAYTVAQNMESGAQYGKIAVTVEGVGTQFYFVDQDGTTDSSFDGTWTGTITGMANYVVCFAVPVAVNFSMNIVVDGSGNITGGGSLTNDPCVDLTNCSIVSYSTATGSVTGDASSDGTILVNFSGTVIGGDCAGTVSYSFTGTLLGKTITGFTDDGLQVNLTKQP